jgi:hypothetical protein
LAVNACFSDSRGQVALQLSSEIAGVSDLLDSVSNESKPSSLFTTTGLVSTSDAATFLERQTPSVANGNDGVFHRNAVAAAFADADVMEWAASTPAARPSASDADISLLSDDLLEAIGRQWQN